MTSTVIVAESGLGRYQQEIIVGGKHHLIGDEPASVGGADAGPAPFDFLMSALGSCTSMTLRMYAERKNLPLTRISVTLSHDKIDVDGKPQDRISRHIQLEGELTEEQRQRCLEIAGKCPIHRALQQPLHLDCQLVESA